MDKTTPPFPLGEDKKPKPRQRAAMYTRMPDEHQKYSLENQTIAIAEYAAKRGIKVVKQYAD